MGRDAADQEVAAELDVSLGDYNRMLQDSASSKLFSFDEITSGDDKPEEQLSTSTASSFDGIQANALRQGLGDAVGTLLERERLVLVLYYGGELNLREIGLILEVGESRVSQAHSQTARRLSGRMWDWQWEDTD